MRYLRAQGSRDAGRVAAFRDLVNRVEHPDARRAILDCAATVARLYGDIFRDLDARHPADVRAA